MLKFFKKYKNDIILIGAVLTVALMGILVLKLTQKDGAEVLVIINGETKYTYSLNEDLQKVISQDGKQNTLVICDGFAYIESASCPDKICVSHRKISKAGETIVCLPNKLVIEIE